MVNITNPIYTSVSDCSYHCHLTDTGVWLCKHTDLNGVAITAFGIGFAISATLMLVLCFLIDRTT